MILRRRDRRSLLQRNLFLIYTHLSAVVCRMLVASKLMQTMLKRHNSSESNKVVSIDPRMSKGLCLLKVFFVIGEQDPNTTRWLPFWPRRLPNHRL